MKYFKVKTGYGKDDFISISELELPTAVRAQITGKVGVFEEGTISGNNIMSITPDYNRLMGWKRDYQLSGEDYDQIGSNTVKEHRECIQNARNSALGIMPESIPVLPATERETAVKRIAETKRIKP